MIEFGKTLRAAREAKGFSVRQLAEITRMAPMTVQELESENFSHLAAPIYGRGFVKLYCKAVGIDPTPLVDEFMELYSGNRDTIIRERPLPGSPATEAPASDAAHSETPPKIVPIPTPEPEPDLFHPNATETSAAELPASDVEPPLTRYASPLRQPRTGLDSATCLRLGLLSGGALLVLVLILCGIRAVYHATTRPTTAETTSVATPIKIAAPAIRTPQKIPSLYID